MKKIIAVILAMVVLMSGCGGNKPSSVSDEMYEVAIRSIKVVDMYLDGEATVDETYDKLSEVDIPDAEIGGEYEKDFSVSIRIIPLKTTMLSIKRGENNLSKLKEERNELAKIINYR